MSRPGSRILPSFSKSRSREEGFCQPRFTWHTREDGFEIEVLAPGVQPGDVELAVEGNELIVVAHRRQPVLANWQPANLAGALPDYRLRIPLPHGVDTGRIGAVLKDGVLTIRLKRQVSRGPRFRAA